MFERKRYIKKREFMDAVFTIYGAHSYEDLITLRDALNVVIKYKAVNSFNLEDYLNSLKGYVTYGELRRD